MRKKIGIVMIAGGCLMPVIFYKAYEIMVVSDNGMGGVAFSISCLACMIILIAFGISNATDD